METKPRRIKLHIKPPRKPISDYGFFVLAYRNPIKEQYPSKDLKFWMSKLKLLWKTLDSEEKNRFLELHDEDVERFTRQSDEYKSMGQYFDDQGEVVFTHKQSIAKLPDSFEIKRPPPMTGRHPSSTWSPSLEAQVRSARQVSRG
jgi:hypothetical protein